MSESAFSPEGLSELTEVINGWFDLQLNAKTLIQSVEYNEGERSWFVRVTGEEKENSMIVFTLGQRTLQYETYFMPAPEENTSDVFEYLLRKNQKLFGASFGIGVENAIYLTGQIGNQIINSDTLDWVLGTLYSAIELSFKPALRIGFASRFKSA
ncbi:MAG: hypothetical protein CL470_08655 [Acidimicrobiaceae bacterium]|nr:hypothetical protein [Acidimicrobiaceae bacterium]|tara:strand:- start:761 stop:1225 length:465 start_codon:yes stop_codon:yes gene_type:complete